MFGDSEDECNEKLAEDFRWEGLNYSTVNGFVKYCEPSVCVS